MNLPLVDRLHLLVALVSALTGTWWGVGTAVLVLAVLTARRRARRHVASWSSVAAGRPSLAAPEHSEALHAPGQTGQTGARA